MPFRVLPVKRNFGFFFNRNRLPFASWSEVWYPRRPGVLSGLAGWAVRAAGCFSGSADVSQIQERLPSACLCIYFFTQFPADQSRYISVRVTKWVAQWYPTGHHGAKGEFIAAKLQYPPSSSIVGITLFSIAKFWQLLQSSDGEAAMVKNEQGGDWTEWKRQSSDGFEMFCLIMATKGKRSSLQISE